MLNFCIYASNTRGNSNTCVFPHKLHVTYKQDFLNAIKYDHVCAKYKNDYRLNDNFEYSDVIPMDLDNEHSDNPNDWINPVDIELSFPDCNFVICYSRNHMKEKNGKSPRPRLHVYFPIDKITDKDEYSNLKIKLQKYFSYFDASALDAAKLIYATDIKDAEIYEGTKTVDELISEIEFANFDNESNQIQQGSRNNHMSHFAGKILKRYGISEKSKKAFEEESYICNPPLDNKELKKIWQSAVKFYKKLSSQEGYVPPNDYENISWDKPIPFEREDMPVFPINALPDVLKQYAMEVANSTQTPIDMAAVGTLTIISACMRNLYKVEGKKNWLEPTNIYSVIIAEPSERKSAVTALVTKPVDEFIKAYNDAHKVEFEMSKATKQKLENKKNSLLSQSKRKGEDKTAVDFNDELREVVEALVNFDEVKPSRIYVDDITTEKLTEVLAENNNAISIISSEGGIFDVISGTYSNKVNIDVFLKAYSGENISVERIMRNSITVEKACLTILLSVQPVVIGELMKNKKFRHRGLTARFLYTTPKSNIGNRKLSSSVISKDTYEEYKKLIFDILNDQSKDEIITLNDGAREILSEYYEWVEKMLVGEFTVYSDWLGKLVGNTLRIAGIISRASVLRGNCILCDSIVIDENIMKNSILIAKYFLTHAVNAYGDMGVRSDIKSVIMVLEKFKDKSLSRITRRDVMRNCRWISDAEEAQNIIDKLEDNGYLKLIDIEKADKIRGGRPKNPIYQLNPMI